MNRVVSERAPSPSSSTPASAPVPATRGLACAILGGALAGFSLGAIECSLLVRAMQATVATPVLDSVGVAGRYSVAGGIAALAAWAIQALRRRGGGAGGAVGLAVGGLAFVIAGDWVHQRALANIGFLAPVSLAATAGIAVGAVLTGLLARRVVERRPKCGVLAAALVIAAAVGSIALHRPGSAPGGRARAEAPVAIEGAATGGMTPAKRRNVLLLVIDTLRADRLGCYGYERPTSPEIDRLAARGVVFDQAIAAAPMTRGSIASLFTSLDPEGHGTNDVLERLPDSADTLAERLGRAGYTTACFSTNENVSPVFGFDQGFDTFWLHRLSRLGRFTAWGRLEHWVTETLGFGRQSADLDDSDARHLTDAVLGWLPAAPTRPQFLYVQYIDPHSPYAPPEDLINADPPDPAWTAARGRFPHNCPPHPFGAWPEQETGVLDAISRLYDAEVRFCDREVGRLVRELESRGFLRDGFVVITADHGEEFFDHAQMGHGHSLYEELVRVPLVVLGPGIEPGRVAAPVQLIDLLPTLATLVGGVPEAGAGGGHEPRGKDLSALLQSPAAERAQLAAEVVAPFAVSVRAIEPAQAMVRVGSEKLIVIEHDGETCMRLFDLAADPREQNDLAAARPDRVSALRTLLDRRRTAARATRLEGTATVELSPDSRNTLKALGYLTDD
jgi:arylsulfatase A-like enzyme